MRSVNAITVKYWNNIADERQLAHVIRPGDSFGQYDEATGDFDNVNTTDITALDIYSLDSEEGVFGGDLIGRILLSSLERTVKTGKNLRIPVIPASDNARIDRETAKNLLAAIHRKLNPEEVFDFLKDRQAG